MPSPRVSVILSVYNDTRYIEESIRSVLDQSYRDLELIVVDDGSTDDTAALVRSFKDLRLTLNMFPRNAGTPVARNAGLDIARGAYITVVDADDPIMAERISLQVNFLDSHPNIAAVGSHFIAIDGEGRFLFDSRQYGVCPVGRAGHLVKVLRGSISTMHPCTTYRGDLLRRFRYDESLLVGHDYDLGLRLYEAGFETDNLDCHLCRHREHARSLTSARFAVDVEDHHKAFSRFARSLLGRDIPDDTLRGYALPYHFGRCPPGVVPLERTACAKLLQSLLGAYQTRFPHLCSSETRRQVEESLNDSESTLLAAYWKELLQKWSLKGTIALYGAGQHTEWVLFSVAGTNDIRMECVLDDAPRSTTLGGLPVLPTGGLADAKLDVIIVSSDAHHRAMADKLRSLVGTSGPCVVDPYEAIPGGPFKKSY